MTIPFIVVCVVAIVFFVSSIRVLREYERAVIMRLGKFVGVCGPGIVFLIPVVDKAKIVDLNKQIPEWRELPETVLDDRVQTEARVHHEK
jgi:regulator of protease activity HflC (stomatin/prohibitin superfamily)